MIIDQKRFGMQSRYWQPRYLHAKFILFEMPDGSKALLSGSNNFSWRGVAYGTKEIALYSTDAMLWQQLHAFLQQHIAISGM